ncbi:hypothetical protein B0T14DRAFT_563629 [Immersiella caudata]|uniref:Amidase domain-containing protein n=1 Tax=Immersiella caudata TaxID=314043 RepID=A0AA40C6Z2_9PEZI|nr:hypothetical protein B0T14DRAFT_563629 [Immersiella caudata]
MCLADWPFTNNYDLKGIWTIRMNRAYNKVYPPCTSSADFVTKLTQLGAVIVGKTEMSAFASAEEPTDQWVDYHCPFDPRGDAYQTNASASLAGIIDTWASNPPAETGGKPLLEYLEMSAVWPMYYDTYHTFDDSRKMFGKPAYVGPSIAVPFTKDQRDQGVEEMKIFRSCFEKKIMGPDKDTVTDAVTVVPFDSTTPNYRYDANKLPSIVGSFSVYYLPPVLQLPTLVVPSREAFAIGHNVRSVYHHYQEPEGTGHFTQGYAMKKM